MLLKTIINGTGFVLCGVARELAKKNGENTKKHIFTGGVVLFALNTLADVMQNMN